MFCKAIFGLKPSLIVTCLLTALLVSSCGGGSQSNETPEKPPVIPAIDTEAPSVDVLFPLPVSRTEASSITVKGTASDSSGIKEVRVNGVVAELETSNDNKNATWHVEVEASRNLIVESEDSLGNINNTAASITVLQGEVPFEFIIDKENERIIGRNSLNGLVTIDLNSLESETIELDNTIGLASYIAYSNKDDLVLAAYQIDNQIQILTVDLQSGFTNVAKNYNVVDEAIDFSWSSLKDVTFSQEENTLYLLVNSYYSGDKGLKSLILKYVLDTGNISTIVDGFTVSGKGVSTNGIAYSSEGLLLINQTYLGNYHYNTDGYDKLLLDASDIVELTTTPDLSPQIMTVNNKENIAFSVGWEGVEKIDITTGSKEQVSLESTESELNFSQMLVADFDDSNNRLLVSDSDLDMIVSVDIETGSRSRFMHNGVGSGKPLIYPVGVVIHKSENKAYIADSGGNGPEVVFEVDLETGNRTILGDINNQYNVEILDLILDNTNRSLYIVFYEEILKVNIDTQEVETLTGQFVGTGSSIGVFTGASLDLDNNRLLVTDGQKKLVMAVDLETGNRSIVSSHILGVGEGSELGWLSAIALDSSNQLAYVASSADGAVYFIDTNSGDRQKLLDSCAGNDIKGNEGNLYTLFFDEEDNMLYMDADKLLKYDVQNAQCESSLFSNVSDIALTDKGQVIAVSKNVLKQLDMSTGESVIISK